MPEAGLVRVCAEADVPAHGGLRIERPELPEAIAVFRWDGQYYAVSDTCTHADASLAEGDVEDCQVECPMHFARFDLRTGRACSLPAIVPVRTYALEVSGGSIYVSLRSAS